ncbi:hypothetical protein E2P81_ATG05538 [Venturia nashicola]|nr:hypothetical protein E2P81_ATG05538 [Venturia nashicola]
MYNMNTLGFLAIVHSLFATLGNALILQDLPHLPLDRRALDSARLFNLQENYQALDLRSKESFFWGGQNGTTTVLGNLTISMPGTNENIISMERFKGMTKSVTCSNTNIDIVFNNNQALAYARGVWDWVNGADNHTFIMVAGAGDCGWNDHRIPFMVSTLYFNDKSMTARLTANAAQWSDAIHTYSLDVGAMPIANITPSAKFRRSLEELDLRKDLSLNFNHIIPATSVSFPYHDLTLSFMCIACQTTGHFDFGFHLETVSGVPKTAYAILNPQGVSLVINPKVNLGAKLKSPLTFSKNFLTVPLSSISIPGGVFDVGPELVFSAGLDIGPLAGSATISSGVKISLPDTAAVTVDVLSPHVTSTGWRVRVSKSPIVVTASLSGMIKTYIRAQIQLDAKAFGKGFDTGIGIQPFISTSLTAAVNNGPVCKNDKKKHSQGLTADANYGIEAMADIQVNGKTRASANIVTYQLPLAHLCLPFGP